MTRSTTRTDGNAQFRRLGVAGRDVVSVRGQIASILRTRVGRAAANLLAVAHTDGGDSDDVTWRAESGANLTPISSLSPQRAQALRERHRELAAEIAALASRLDADGGSGRQVGYLLRLALVTPDGHESLHAAGDQPVLVNWGHAVEGQSVPEMDEPRPPPVTMTSTAGEADPPAVVASPAEDSVRGVAGDSRNEAGTHAEHRWVAGWIAWALPLLLLCAAAAFSWKLMTAPAPIVVERTLPGAPPEDPVSAARSRLAALASELANARAVHAELVELCVPAPEPSSERPGTPPPARTAIVEPEVVPLPAKHDEPPAVVVEPDPVPKLETLPRVGSRSPPELPPEVPRVAELPPRSALLPASEEPEPTLCEPEWTPVERPEVLVVVDGSGSMKEPFPGARSRIAAARDAVSLVVDNLHHEIVTGLVSFTDCGETSTPEKYTYRERPKLLARVRGLSPSRRTSLANSIRRAGNAAKSVGPATVVVVSDGDDTCGGDPCGVARAIKSRKPLLKINVLDLSDTGSAALQCVADVSGGRVFVPGTAAQMNEELQEATGQPDAGHCNP